jgi:hypothetical protein
MKILFESLILLSKSQSNQVNVNLVLTHNQINYKHKNS